MLSVARGLSSVHTRAVLGEFLAERADQGHRSHLGPMRTGCQSVNHAVIDLICPAVSSSQPRRRLLLFAFLAAGYRPPRPVFNVRF